MVLKVTVPAYSAKTTKCATKLDPATDVCQVEVQVRTSNGGKRREQDPARVHRTLGWRRRSCCQRRPNSTTSRPQRSPASRLSTAKLRCRRVGLRAGREHRHHQRRRPGRARPGLGECRPSPEPDIRGLRRDLVQRHAAAAGAARGAGDRERARRACHRTDRRQPQHQYRGPRSQQLQAGQLCANPVVTSIEVLRNGSASKYDAGPSTGGTELVIKGTGLQAGHEFRPVHRRWTDWGDVRLLESRAGASPPSTASALASHLGVGGGWRLAGDVRFAWCRVPVSEYDAGGSSTQDCCYEHIPQTS